MPTFEITAPDGKKYDVTGDNAEGAYSALISMLGGDQAEQTPVTAPTEPYVDEQGVTRYPNLQQVESGAFEDIVGAGLAGMARGVKGLAETPEMLGRAAIRGGQELAQLAGAEVENEMPVLDTATGRGIEAALSTFGGDKAMAYRGESTPAQFAGTIGEFVGPGGLLGGGKKLMQASVAAGAGSEAAGQLTEGEPSEAYARMAGALISPAALSAAARGGRKVISPYSGADEAKLLAAKKLEEKGVEVLAGQKVDDALLERQAGSRSGQKIRENQVEQFSKAALKEIGSTFKRATPDALIEAQTRIGGEMNAAMAGIKAQASADDLKAASSVIQNFKKNKPVGDEAKTPNKLIKEVNKRLINTAITTGGKDQLLDAEAYQSLRSQLSKQTTSNNAAVRDASVGMLNVLDGVVDQAMRKAGRAEDFAKLQSARSNYRNYLAIEKSVSGAGQSKALGIIEPKALDSAMRSQGARSYNQGKRGELGDLAKAGAQVLSFPNIPPVGFSTQLFRMLAQGAPYAAIGAVTGMPPAAIAVVSAFAPSAITKLLNTSAGQKYLINQLVQKGEGIVKEDYAKALVSGLAAEITDNEDQQ